MSNSPPPWIRSFPAPYPHFPLRSRARRQSHPQSSTSDQTSQTSSADSIDTDNDNDNDNDNFSEEIDELKSFLISARRFDTTGVQPDYVLYEKIALIRYVAELVDIDVDQVFGATNQTEQEQ